MTRRRITRRGRRNFTLDELLTDAESGHADEAAQERGEVKRTGNSNYSKRQEELPGVSDLEGLTHKDIHEARIIRDAEVVSGGECDIAA